MNALNSLDRLHFAHEMGRVIMEKVMSSSRIFFDRQSEKRVSQWEELMRKFSDSHKEECKKVLLEIPRASRSLKQFPTGSQYEGTWDVLGMSGYGVYNFPNGVIYEGNFDDGMFHGEGELRYPSGAILRGTWRKGVMVERALFFADGLEYAEHDWTYCRMPDRRFTVEYEKGLQPAGKSFLTADQPTRDIPNGFYDTGDGFYDPKTKMVYSADDITAIIRSPSAREQKWIMENCRTCPVVPLGPRPELYEEWSRPQLEPPVMASTPMSRAQSFMDPYVLDEDDDNSDELMEKARSSSSPGRLRSRPFLRFDRTPITYESAIDK